MRTIVATVPNRNVACFAPRFAPRFALCFALLVAMVGCRLSPFDDIEKTTPIVALDPGTYDGRGFGNVMAAYVGRTGTARVVASAGIGTEQIIMNVWQDGELGSLNSVDSRCNDIRTPDPDCSLGVGAALVGISDWNGLSDCYITSQVDAMPGVTEPSDDDDGELLVMCEIDGNSRRVLPIMNIDLGRDLASLPADNPAGVVLISAPGAPAGGQLYRLRSADATPTPIANPAGVTLGPNARLGTGLAARALTSFPGLDQPVLVAAGAPGDQRVIVYAMGGVAGAIELRPLACIDGVTTRAPAELAGGELAIGNVDSDPELEVLIGDPTNNRVRIANVDPSGMAVGCLAGDESDDPPVTDIVCPADAAGTEGVACFEFGTGLAAGDINVDGFEDLLVGAPNSTTNGKPTGAFYVIPGAAAGPDAAAGRVLIPSSAISDDRIGQSIEVARTQVGTAQERDEPVVGVPGSRKNRIYMFLCTGLPGDEDIDGDRCIR